MEDILAEEIEFGLREIGVDKRQFGGFVFPKQASTLSRSLQAERIPVFLIRGVTHFGIAADVIQHFGHDRTIVTRGVFVSKIIDKRLRYRNLVLGCFAQTHTNRVAYTVGEQSSDTDGRLDTSVFAFARFGHTEVQRERHSLMCHATHKQAHGVHHDTGVGSFDGDDDVLKMFAHSDTQKLHDAFDHTFRRVAIFLHHTRGERTVVHTDADSRLMLAAEMQQMYETLFEFGVVFAVVTRVDTDGFYHFGRSVRYFGIEMHVCHDRHGG